MLGFIPKKRGSPIGLDEHNNYYRMKKDKYQSLRRGLSTRTKFNTTGDIVNPYQYQSLKKG